MNAADVMTRSIVTVSPETDVRDLVNILLSRNITGVPVVDKDGSLAGIVTEGDLIRRAELGTDRQRGGWRAFFTATSTMAQDYVRSHGTKVRDVMTPEVIAITPETPLAEIADLMEEHHVRRLPVVSGNHVVGIVSRVNLLRAWASSLPPKAPEGTDDASLRAALLEELGQHVWSRRPENSVVVTDGIVHLWGLAATDDESRAIELAAERLPGVKGVRNHIVVLEAEPYPLLLGA